MEPWQTPSCREKLRGTANEESQQDSGWMIYGIQLVYCAVPLIRCNIVLCCRHLRKGVWVKVSFGVGKPAVHWKSMLFKCFLSPSFRPLSCGADVSDQSPPSNPIMCLFPQSPFCQAVFDAVHPPHPSSFPSLFTHLLVFSSHTCPYHFKLLPCTLLAIYPFHCSFICHTLCYVASLFWFDYLFSYRSWTLIQTARRYMSTSCDVEGPTTRSRT